MKEKNGFVFVETIVVCSILAVSLVTIYASFILLVNDQKRRSRYDQTIYNYRLYNLAKLLTDDEIKNCELGPQEGKSTPIEDYYRQNKNEINLSILKINTFLNLKGEDTDIDLKNYLKTIDEEDEACLLIGKFESTENDKTVYYYSHIKLNKD